MISGARYQRVATYSVRNPVWSCSGSAIRARPKSQIWNPTQAAKLGGQSLHGPNNHNATPPPMLFPLLVILSYSGGLPVTWKPQAPREEGRGNQSSDLKVAGGVDEQVGGL